MYPVDIVWWRVPSISTRKAEPKLCYSADADTKLSAYLDSDKNVHVIVDRGTVIVTMDTTDIGRVDPMSWIT